MSSLINRIQRAMLGSAGAEKVRVLLAELAIPAGGSGGSMREVRRGFLRPISDETILRDALANLGLSGGGGGGTRSLSNIRTAILHNLRASESVLRDGLNELLAPDDLSGEDGGAGGLDWVPADAVIHVDLLNDRAWTEASGEVAVDTLLGGDPNTENGWSESGYDSGNLTSDGYLFPIPNYLPLALIGSALAKLLVGATSTVGTKEIIPSTTEPAPLNAAISFVVMSADGSNAVEIDTNNNHNALVRSWGGGLDETYTGIVNAGEGAANVVALTLTESRLDLAVSGSSAAANILTEADRPPDAFVAAMIDAPGIAIQSITFYDPLPDTTGLSELSVVA